MDAMSNSFYEISYTNHKQDETVNGEKSWKLEAGSWKEEVNGEKSRKLEAGSWKEEVNGER